MNSHTWETVFRILLAGFVLLGTLRVLSVWLAYIAMARRKQEPLESYPKVGVIVPHYNEDAKILTQALESLEMQDYPVPIIILVADDGSTNHIQVPLASWLQRARRQEYISVRFERNSGSKGKNMDATLPYVPKDVEVLVVVDSDTYLERQSIRRVVERLWQDDRCAAVCGLVVPANERYTIWQRFQYFEHIGIYPAMKCAQDVVGLVDVMAGAFVAHRMSVVRDVGGWGEWIVEDVAWTWKALASGYRTGYAPHASAYTYGPANRHSLFRQRRRWSRGRMEAFRVAIKTSPSRTVFLAPLLVPHILNVCAPVFWFVPILAVLLDHWWFLGAIVALSVGSLITLFRCQGQLPRRLRKGFVEVLRSGYYNALFQLWLWRPQLCGLLDECLGKPKAWLTRDCKSTTIVTGGYDPRILDKPRL